MSDARYPKMLRRAAANGKAFPDFTGNLDDVKMALGQPILVVGAGGLGCELLKNLALVGFTNVHVVDMDTIDVTNLNRQFLFRAHDVGSPKSTVAAKFVMERVPECTITAYLGSIQEMLAQDSTFYRKFSMIVCGLDSIPARRWMNSLLVSMVRFDNDGNLFPQTIIPMLDGGTEGWKGSFQMCTLVGHPRQPEHCIAWAKTVLWDKKWPFGDKVSIDTDNAEHMQWLFERALERAEEYNISGVTFKKTQGVVKNIIPAIASTNAMCAAITANEAYKYVTRSSLPLNNWIMLNSAQGEHTYTYEHERNEACPECMGKPTNITVDGSMTLQEFVDELKTNAKTGWKSVNSIRDGATNKSIYWPKFDKKGTQERLPKPIKELFADGASLFVYDKITMEGIKDNGATLVVSFS